MNSVTRAMSKEREREYAELHAYLDFYSTHVLGMDPLSPIHPTSVAKGIVAQHGRSKALDGLKQAVNDTVEELADQPPEYVANLDSALREAGVLTFSEVRRRYASAYKRILKRGTLKTETEYYLVAGVLADVSSSAGPEERAVLEKLVSQYKPGGA